MGVPQEMRQIDPQNEKVPVEDPPSTGILDAGCLILDKLKRNPPNIQHPETSIQHRGLMARN